MLIHPGKQSIWGWSATANFILGGMGAGLYLLLGVFQSFDKEPPQSDLFILAGPFLVLCGFAFLALEAGRPRSSVHVFRNFAGSWMSREALSGLIFIVSAVFHFFYGTNFLFLTAWIAALFFLLSQAMIPVHATAVPSWSTHVVTFLFVSSSLLSGIGLLLFNPSIPASPAAGTGCVIVLLNLVLWRRYLHFRAGRLSPGKASRFFLDFGGHILPLMLFLIILAGGRNGVLFWTAGLSAAGGAALVKHHIVRSGVIAPICWKSGKGSETGEMNPAEQKTS